MRFLMSKIWRERWAIFLNVRRQSAKLSLRITRAKSMLQRLRRSGERTVDCESAERFRPHTHAPPALPEGLSETDLRKIFATFSIDSAPAGHMNAYVEDAFYRFLHSWSLVRHQTGTCLELGANPYFITWLLKQHTSLEVTLSNFFGGGNSTGMQTLSWESETTRQAMDLTFDHFNSEEDIFPYRTESFDVVLYCEIIEHLLMNPVHTLKEIRRILKPGGLLVVTTPNVARFGNVIAIAEGRSIYDPYSGFGPYGRHNREFSMPELLHLLEFCGFTHETSFTADAHLEDWSHHPLYDNACTIGERRPHHLGQYLFAGVRATGTAREGLPGSLFRSHPDGLIDHSW